MTETKRTRTPEQKAAHAEKERARRAARKVAEGRADEIVAERDAADDFAAGALAAAIMGGTVLANATPSDLSEMDSVTLYRKAKLDLACRKADPSVATPHLDELEARKGRKVIAGGKTPKAARASKRADRHPLFVEAMRIKKTGARGAGIKVTDEEMAEHCRRLAAAGVSRAEALEVIYWVDRVSRGAPRFFAVWDATITVAEGAAI